MTEERSGSYSMGGLRSFVKGAIDTSIENTRRIFRMGEESQAVGRSTLVALEEQKEQVNKIDEHMDSIEADMKTTEMYLTELEKGGEDDFPSFQEFFQWPFFSKENESKDEPGMTKENKTVENRPVSASDNGTLAAPSTGFLAKIKKSRKQEKNDNLQKTNSSLGKCRNEAIDAVNEIDLQNSRLDRINQKAISNRSRIKNLDERSMQSLKE